MGCNPLLIKKKKINNRYKPINVIKNKIENLNETYITFFYLFKLLLE